jgi:dihydropteroate synthase
VSDALRLHNPRVIAGTLDGFEGFARFRTGLVDPIRTLLPFAVELEAVPVDAGRSLAAHLRVAGCFVDDRDLEGGLLRLAAPLERFEVLPGLLRDLPPELLVLVRCAAAAVAARIQDSFEVKARGRTLRLGKRPWIMAVLNVTPDSFSDGGRFAAPHGAIERAFELAEQGADVVDVGGESTRPGASAVPVDQEWARVEPVLRVLGRELKAPLSIDTMKSEVAERALDLGVAIVNDVSGLDFDPRMAEVAARKRAALIVNHMRGSPRTMQESPRYDDPVAEIAKSLRERAARARDAGVPDESLLLDPGIGFGKRLEDNLDVLARLPELRSLGRPLVLGCSRKSFLGLLTSRGVDERSFATAATTALAAFEGVKLIRVHDVPATRDVLAVLEAVDARVRIA